MHSIITQMHCSQMNEVLEMQLTCVYGRTPSWLYYLYYK